jgi:hypothetical protein
VVAADGSGTFRLYTLVGSQADTKSDSVRGMGSGERRDVSTAVFPQLFPTVVRFGQ